MLVTHTQRAILTWCGGSNSEIHTEFLVAINFAFAVRVRPETYMWRIHLFFNCEEIARRFDGTKIQ